MVKIRFFPAFYILFYFCKNDLSGSQFGGLAKNTPVSLDSLP